MTKEEIINYLHKFGYKVIREENDKVVFEREYVGRYNSTTLRVGITAWFELDSEKEKYILTDYIEQFYDNDIRLSDSLDVDDYSDLLGLFIMKLERLKINSTKRSNYGKETVWNKTTNYCYLIELV